MIAETLIRSAIKLLLQEGFVIDKAKLIELYPEIANSLHNAPPKAIAWLIARFCENPPIKETHPIEDSISILFDYLNKSNGITQKYMSNNDWKTIVDDRIPIEKRKWKLPSAIQFLTVDDMSTLMSLLSLKKQTVDTSESNIQEDYLGKVGPWNLWLPSTTANSCKIAGYDPKTFDPYTTWCTARTSGENFFNSYLSYQKDGLFLVYIIRDNASRPDDWISIAFNTVDKSMSGFIDKTKKKDGSWCVNAENLGYSEEDLKEHFFEFYEPIKALLTEKLSTLKEHPGKEKIKKMSQDINKFRAACRGLSKYTKYDLFKDVIMSAVDFRPPDEVIKFIIESSDASDLTYNGRLAIKEIAAINDLSLEIVQMIFDKQFSQVMQIDEIIAGENNIPDVAKFLIDRVEKRLMKNKTSSPLTTNVLLNIIDNNVVMVAPKLLIDIFDVGKDISDNITKNILKRDECVGEIAQHIIDIIDEQEDADLLSSFCRYCHDENVLENFVETHELNIAKTIELVQNDFVKLSTKLNLIDSADKYCISAILSINPVLLEQEVRYAAILSKNATQGALLTHLQKYSGWTSLDALEKLQAHPDATVREYATSVIRQRSSQLKEIFINNEVESI